MNAEVKMMRTAAETQYSDALSALPAPEPIRALREKALRLFAEKGLPHRRVEEWKYTDLRVLLREMAPLAGKPDARAIAEANKNDVLSDIGAREITFVNGAFAAELSKLKGLEQGLRISTLADALKSDPTLPQLLAGLNPSKYDAVFALNTAALNEGVVIDIAPGAQIAKPIHIRHIVTGTSPVSVFGRAVVKVGKKAQATIVQSHAGPDAVAYQTNTILQLSVADDAELDIVRVQAEGDKAIHLSMTIAAAGAKSRFRSFALTTGAAVSRHTVPFAFAGKDIRALISGATLLRGKQHTDMTLEVDHAQPGGESRELFKTVLDDESRGVFQGLIVVRPDAQKTDGRMMSAALLLGESAEMDNKPELEIFADDVQCAHGATTGALDDDLLFYLRARGIPKKEAESLLIQSFFGEAIETIENQKIRDAVMSRASAWLAARAVK
ncbi:MAG: Fe-S cluster assembly protein SufD [Xanthobacteraceae bacterium]|nr:Fe-S cluster assembly protein SufD [Xanthobacteraceae bacterium]